MLSEINSNVHNHEPWDGNEDFAPIPGLLNPDGDLALIFLSSNGIGFYDITSDPWYRATVPGDTVYTEKISEGWVEYQSEEAASPMGCVTQYQFCNPSLSDNNCGPLASWADAQDESARLFGLTAEEMENGTVPATSNTIGSRYSWLIQAFVSAQPSIATIILNLGPDALTSLKYLNGGMMGPLPANQWQLDVRYWWATYMAVLQAAVVNSAYGPTDPALAPYKVLPFNSHARDMCNNQVRYSFMKAHDHKMTRSG